MLGAVVAFREASGGGGLVVVVDLLDRMGTVWEWEGAVVVVVIRDSRPAD